MQIQLREKNDIKIFILYLMRHIGYPLEFASINDIVLQDGIVNYFDFAECFAELIETGNIEELRGEDTVTYRVTEQGKSVCDSLQSDLIQTIRERSLKSAVRLLDFEKKGWTTKRSYTELPDGRFEFNCKVLEHKKEYMNITLVVENRKALDRMLYNFDERPEVVYRGLMSVLTGEINYLL